MGGRRTSTFVRAYNRDAVQRIRERLSGLSEEQLQKAADRALVTVIRRVQPVAKADIRERYGVRATALNDRFRVVKGSSRKGDPYLGVWASSRKISLIDFSGRWRRKSAGATAQVKAGERRTYDSAFIATVEGRRAIRVRSFKNGVDGARVARGPLRMLRGPSPFEMLLGEDMANGAKVSEKLLTTYESEIARQLKVLRRGRI